MHHLIEQLENTLQQGIRVPATGKILVDETALRHVLDEMRETFPDEMEYGQRIAREREQILGDARAQSRRMLEEAEARAQARVEEQAIVQSARQQAREIHADAERRAATLRAEASTYVAHQLNGLEARLQRLLREVQAGQRALVQEPGKRPEGGS